MLEKVQFRLQILQHPSIHGIDEYWNKFGVPILPINVIFTSRLQNLSSHYSETQKFPSAFQFIYIYIYQHLLFKVHFFR